MCLVEPLRRYSVPARIFENPGVIRDQHKHCKVCWLCLRQRCQPCKNVPSRVIYYQSKAQGRGTSRVWIVGPVEPALDGAMRVIG